MKIHIKSADGTATACGRVPLSIAIVSSDPSEVTCRWCRKKAGGKGSA